MDTEASLQEYLRLNLRVPHPGAGRAAGQGLRLRGHRRPRGEGDPHRRQDLLGGAGGHRGPGRAGTSSSSTPPPPATSWPSSAPPRPSRSSSPSGPIKTQTGWMGDLLSDPAVTALNVVDDPRGDARPRDHRAGRAGAGDAARPARAPWSSTGCCPSCSPTPTRWPSRRCASRRRWPPLEGVVGPRRRRRPRRRRPGRDPPADPGRPPGPPPGGGRAARCSTCRSCSSGPRACGSPGWWPTPSARSWACDGHTVEPTSLDRLLATKSIAIFCGPGGVGKTSVAAAVGGGGRRPARRQGPRRHRRPGPAPGRRPRPVGAREPGAARARRAAQGGRASSSAAGCGRPCSTPSRAGTTSSSATPATRRRPTGSSRTGSTTTSPPGSSRATTTSPWSGSTRSTPRAATT